MSAYARLEAHFARMSHIGGALEILHWDMAAMMPEGGASDRAEQLATLKVLHHEMATDERLETWLAKANEENLDDWQSANLREMDRAWRHANAVPAELVSALSKAGSACEMTWRTARKANDFETLAPLLQTVVDHVREVAAAKSESLGLSPYDALMDQYEPGGREARIDGLFEDLAGFLPGFTDEVIAKQAAGPDILEPEGPFAIELQRQVGVEVMTAMGFDFKHGRLDVSHHPFCCGSGGDVRITTRYDESRFTKALMGVIHETGHALYELGLPEKWRGQPVGAARGMSAHESQSLLMEMQACRSAQFIKFLAPKVKAVFGGDGPAWSSENLSRLYTRVRRDLIRVDADEVTYPAHVILRYRLEKALLSGDLQVVDLPGAWREGMLELVGVAPDTDQDGCMQDIHWMDGTLGYFPTYTLGAMTAAQLFQAACDADAEILPALSRGDFTPLLGWLRPNMHGLGSRYEMDDLLIHATGRPLDAEVFKAHLTRRYLQR